MTLARLHVSREDAVTALSALGWDSLAGPADFYLTTEWLPIAASVLRSGSAHYLVATDSGGRLRAGLPGYLYDQASVPSPFTRIDRVLTRLLRERLGGSAPPHLEETLGQALPSLYCGAREISYSRLLLDPALGCHLRREVIRRVAREAESTARDLGARSITFTYVNADDDVLRSSLRGEGFSEFFSSWSCVLDLPWSHFDEYLAGFKTHRRVTIRRERRRLAEAGVVFQVRQLTPDLAAELVALEVNLTRKYHSPRKPEQVERTLKALATQLAHRTVVITASLAGRISGFALFIRSGKRMYARHTGFHYERQGKLPLYFALLFYEAIEHALRSGVTRIEYGTGSLDAKLSRGCTPLRQYGYFKGLEPGLHAEVDGLLGDIREPSPSEPYQRQAAG
ncbi:MAG TPA: GNAT family N-acetyltransferase [Actinomycetes bacterium]|jgi:predicted N-acyltransferase|nr:GNAT family N-acetyltransferase [Actinomycetes bacterium]